MGEDKLPITHNLVCFRSKVYFRSIILIFVLSRDSEGFCEFRLKMLKGCQWVLVWGLENPHLINTGSVCLAQMLLHLFSLQRRGEGYLPPQMCCNKSVVDCPLDMSKKNDKNQTLLDTSEELGKLQVYSKLSLSTFGFFTRADVGELDTLSHFPVL